MTRIFLFYFCLIILVSIGFISCKDTSTNPSLVIVFPESGVSFTKQVEPLFQQRCVDCHGDSSPAADLNLKYPSYTTIINRSGLVVPGDTINSRLVQRITGKSFLMPPIKSTQLTQNQITGIKKWIEEGAQYN